MKLPSVIALKSFIKPQANPSFTRFNVFLRDRFSCQYCGSGDELTFDYNATESKLACPFIDRETNKLVNGYDAVNS